VKLGRQNGIHTTVRTPLRLLCVAYGVNENAKDDHRIKNQSDNDVALRGAQWDLRVSPSERLVRAGVGRIPWVG